MSKRFWVVLLAALVTVSCTSPVGWAEDAQTESQQTGSDVEKDCKGSCCKDGKCEAGERKSSECEGGKCKACCKDGACTSSVCKSCCKDGICKDGSCKGGECKCANCENPNCDQSNCTCAAGAEAGCPCTNVAYSGCDEAGCRATDGVVTNNGSWCPNGCRDCSGTHIGYCWKNDEPSIFGFSGHSLFSGTLPRSSTMSDAIWQQVASELDESRQRNGEAREWVPVRWDETSGQPSACTDCELKTDDRVFVRITPSTETDADANVATPVLPAPQARLAAIGSRSSGASSNDTPQQIQYSIQIIEDRTGCMREYETLRGGLSMMIAESKTLLPTMRVLARSELIDQVSSPKLVCIAGETAELKIGSNSQESSDSVQLGVAGETTEEGLFVQLAMHTTQGKRNFKVCSAVMVEEGQTVVLKANAQPELRNEQGDVEPAMYVLVTPEIVE